MRRHFTFTPSTSPHWVALSRGLACAPAAFARMPVSRRPPRGAASDIDIASEDSSPTPPPAVETEEPQSSEVVAEEDGAAEGRPRFLPFLRAQMGWAQGSGADSDAAYAMMDEKREGIYNFFQVPWNLEPLITFGCGSARHARARRAFAARALRVPPTAPFLSASLSRPGASSYVACLDTFVSLFTILPLRVLTAMMTLLSRRSLSPMQRCDLSRALLITIVSYIMLNVDMSQVRWPAAISS